MLAHVYSMYLNDGLTVFFLLIGLSFAVYVPYGGFLVYPQFDRCIFHRIHYILKRTKHFHHYSTCLISLRNRRRIIHNEINVSNKANLCGKHIAM